MEEDFDFSKEDFRESDNPEAKDPEANDPETNYENPPPASKGKPSRDNLNKLLAYADSIEKRYEDAFDEAELVDNLRNLSERLLQIYLESNPDPKNIERAKYLNDLIQGRKTEFE
jgi:hypothetical protein